MNQTTYYSTRATAARQRKGYELVTVSPTFELLTGKKDIKLKAYGGGNFSVYEIAAAL